MANWDSLKAAISSVIKTNGAQQITGQLLQTTLLNMITTIGEHATFAGVATPSTSPGTSDGPIFYIAAKKGTYSNFGGAVISDRAAVLVWDNGAWTKYDIDVPNCEDFSLAVQTLQTSINKKDNITDVDNKLTGKADLDANKKYLLATQLNPTTGYQTGAIMTKGRFRSTDEGLLLKGKAWTVMACFIMPDTTDGSRLIAAAGTGTLDATTYYYINAYNKEQEIRVSVNGLLVRAYRRTKAGTVAFAAISYTPDGALIARINDWATTIETPEYPYETEPKYTDIGGYDYQPFNMQSTMISFRRFDFAMTQEQITEAYNGGRPEVWRVPDEWRYGEEGQRCILDLVPEGLTPYAWRDMSGLKHDFSYLPYSGSPDACELSYETYESEVAKAEKSIMYGSQTAVAISGSKGYFKSDSPALVTPDQPSTLIVCFKMPQSGTAVIYDCNTTSATTTAKGEYIYVQNRVCRVTMRNFTVTNYSLPGNTQLCMAAISYTPNGTLIRRINERVIENEAPEYPSAYEPEHMRLGGWSSSYVDTRIISVRRFDFAMTKEQLEEAWNGGHPELWRVPDKYRYGEVSARCFLDLNPKGLLPTVWRDMSGHGNDVPYYPMMASSPTECELSYENHGFKDKIFGTAAPTIYPNFTGQEFVDTTNKVTYAAYGTSSAGDWK